MSKATLVGAYDGSRMLCHAAFSTPRNTSNTMAERETGTVKWFDNEKGYGFIVPEEGGEDLFVHYSEIDTEGFKSLDEDDRVEFTVGQTDKGPNAQDVVVIG